MTYASSTNNKQSTPATNFQQPRPSRVPDALSFSSSPPPRGRDQPPNPATQIENDRADALWAEMQNTLADVELSALNSSHVFGTAHAKALEDLRASQLALAQAWAKSEAEEMAEHDFDGEGADTIGTRRDGVLAVGAVNTNTSGAGAAKENDKSKDNKTKSKVSNTSSAATKGKSLEEETERDIQLARRRREANDRYFQQVNRGVLDVVSQLEAVASAMKRVEKESRDIWSESSSGGEDGGAAPSTVTESETDLHTESMLTSSPESNKK